MRDNNGSMPTVILVHGSWHDGACWSAVREHLAAQGIDSQAPTLAWHGREGSRNVSHDDYVDSVLEVLDSEPRHACLVGHSFGGSVISRVAELRPERCHSLVYYSAFVPRDGERVADSLPEPMIDFLEQSAAVSTDDSCGLPFELFHASFANTADEPTAETLHSRLVPEPRRPIFERLSLPWFETLAIPTAYITCRDDQALPPGAFYPGQSSRLESPVLIGIDGDHGAVFTAPDRLASAIAGAVQATCEMNSARR
jgi:pimeloyl-ACP methyl ester carboxylesterase